MSETTSPYPTEADYLAAVAALSEAADAYYNGTGLLMADTDYDLGVTRIEATETIYPDWKVSHTLTGAVAAGTGVGDVPHSVRMLSLDKAHTLDAVSAWWNRTVSGGNVDVTLEPKLDGIAIAARYENGHRTLVLTRGDGTAGEDVTARIPTATVGLPETVDVTDSFEVRGELVFTRDQFEAANKFRVGEGKPEFVNARNALAGSIRREDLPADVRPAVTFYVYDLISDTTEPDDLASARIQRLTGLGFLPVLNLAGAVTVVDLDDLHKSLNQIGERRAMYPFDIDGAVIKVDHRGIRDQLGATGSHPRWAIAFKYPAQEVTTILEDIEVAVGRTGIHSLRGRVQPVHVDGTTITYATLHNPSDLEARDVRPGDTVLIRRAGDVIPEITGHTHRPDNSAPWEMPTDCINCGQPLDQSEKRWRCVNRACTAGAGALLAYAVSRDALDIDGVGENAVVALIEAGLVTDLADLHTLTVEQVLTLEGFGQVSAQNLVDGIAASKAQPLHRLVTALGIRMTGRRMSARLAAHFGTLDTLRTATVDALQEVEGVGDRRATVIRAELDALEPLLDRLVAAGVNTEDINYGTDTTSGPKPLDDMKVCVTGTMTGPYAGKSRTEMNELIETAGGKATGSVSKSTDLLVAGDAAGSKLAKATDLGVKVVTPDELAALLA